MAAFDESAPGASGLVQWILARVFGHPTLGENAPTRDAKRRRYPAGLATMSVAERVAEAFDAIPATDTERRVLAALMRRPGGTAAELTADCGWAGAVWQMHFKLLCEKRSDYLWPADLPDVPDAKFLGAVLADYAPRHGKFTLKSDVARVFRALGYAGAT